MPEMTDLEPGPDDDDPGSAGRVGAEEVGADEVVLDEADPGDLVWIGRAAHQGPDVDGECLVTGDDDLLAGLARGAMVRARVTASDGVDLVVEVLEVLHPGPLAVGAGPAVAGAR